MLDVRFRPMEDPRKHRSRKRAAFRSKWNDTITLIEYEMGRLAARDIVIEAGFRLDQIRNDGWPYSKAVPSHAAVRLSFSSRGKPMAFPCDTYLTIDDNLRAVGLTLKSLRDIDRYGVTQDAEQYKGWLRLEAPPAEDTLDYRKALQFVALHSGISPKTIMSDDGMLKLAFRQAAKKLHPDTGGNEPEFKILQKAMTILEGGTNATQ